MRAQAHLGEAHRLVAVVGDEHRARGQDARRPPRRQRLEIGVDHRVLDVGQRRIAAASCGRGWVRDSMQPVAGQRRRGARPSTVKVACQMRSASAGTRRIQQVAARQLAARQAVRIVSRLRSIST